MQHPLHQHSLYQTDSRTLYPSYNGYWKCDNCGENFDPSNSPLHCTPCSYDICEVCFKGQRFPKHPHMVYLTNMKTIYSDGRWKCDSCGLLNASLPPRFQSLAYHCHLTGCEYDVCQVCFQASHDHLFTKIGRPNFSSTLICNVCSGEEGQRSSSFAIFCSDCRFTVCESCLSNNFFSSHPHPLHLTDCRTLYPEASNRWNCDSCGVVGSPNTAGLTSNFHCRTCDFDICINCMERDRAKGPRMSVPSCDVPGPPADTFRNLGLGRGTHYRVIDCNFKPCDEDQST